ncbi:MAG: helix-turn-helix transcriptional regulator [Lagierella massiliensis]|nr:helix-turn-helix transcriptional regulator [Lagierella massiliensis]
MARNQFQYLSEPMFYILLALNDKRNGSEITDWVYGITDSRIKLAPGTLYALLSQFLEKDLIEKVKSEKKGKYYLITKEGRKLLIEEKNRLQLLIKDFNDNYY